MRCKGSRPKVSKQQAPIKFRTFLSDLALRRRQAARLLLFCVIVELYTLNYLGSANGCHKDWIPYAQVAPGSPGEVTHVQMHPGFQRWSDPDANHLRKTVRIMSYVGYSGSYAHRKRVTSDNTISIIV